MLVELLDQQGVRDEAREAEGNGELRTGLGAQRGFVRKLPCSPRGRLSVGTVGIANE